jgi:hypothetical protein
MSTTSIGLTDARGKELRFGSSRELPASSNSLSDPSLDVEGTQRTEVPQRSDATAEPEKAEEVAGYPWPRLLRVVVLLVVYFVLEFVVKSLTVTQFLFVAWRKRPHARLQRWGETIATYMNQMWRYCTFASDTAPWPFSPWPRVTGST